jgi:hypothetical protein
MKKDLIFEELSVSDEVNNVGNSVISDIIDKIQNDIGTYHQHGVLCKQCNLYYGKPLFDLVLKIHIDIFFFKDKESVRKYYLEYDLGGEFDKDNMELTVKGYGIGDNINLEYLKGILFHELKHAYQASLYTTAPSVPNILQIATTIISSDIYNKNNLIYLLSRLIYYFSKKEIDANIESLYQELKETKPNDVKEFLSQTINEYEYHKALYNDCKSYIADDSIINTIYQIYGKTFKQLMRYVQNGISYFEIRKRKVYMKYINDTKKIYNESQKFKRVLFVR